MDDKKTRKSCDTVIFYVCHSAFFVNITLLCGRLDGGGGKLRRSEQKENPGNSHISIIKKRR